MANIILSAFLDGFTGGSLFTQARLPGEPTQLFADEDSECEHSELVAALLAIQEREDQEADSARSTNPVYLKDEHESFEAGHEIEIDLSKVFPSGYGPEKTPPGFKGLYIKGFRSIGDTRKDTLGSMIRLTQKPEEAK